MRRVQKLEPSEDREEAWWNVCSLEENKGKKGTKKWDTLIHNGVLFQEPYVPLPEKVKIKYNGIPIKLDSKNIRNPFGVTAEEAAVFFAMKNEQDDRLAEKNPSRKKARDDQKFVENFWKDWKKILGKNTEIKDFSLVDFSPIQKYIAKRSEEKKSSRKSLSKEEKQEEKQKKEEIKDLYGYAIVDGIKIPIGSYALQPAGLYIGHGNHPARGRIKKRVEPSDVTINVSKDKVPRCYLSDGSPCTWGDVVEDKNVTWIASYRHPITEELNYIYLKRDESHFVCSSDMQKFEKAKKLGKNIQDVRRKYQRDLKDTDKSIQQLAVAVYLLDELAIRPGVDKDETKEADTVGLTTLKCGNFKFKTDDKIEINFTGKSSIDFKKTFVVPSVVYNILKSLCKGKKDSDKIFPLINATSLNNYLKEIVPELTAKVFRTYKASSILQQKLDELEVSSDATVDEKKLMYDRANINVALALNHKRMGGDSGRIEKIKAKLQEYIQKKEEASTEKKKMAAQNGIDRYTSKLEEATENVATTTSKTNYLDPRIVVAWCKKVEMPIEKIYNKTNLKKFVWGMGTKSSWSFGANTTESKEVPSSKKKVKNSKARVFYLSYDQRIHAMTQKTAKEELKVINSFSYPNVKRGDILSRDIEEDRNDNEGLHIYYGEKKGFLPLSREHNKIGHIPDDFLVEDFSPKYWSNVIKIWIAWFAPNKHVYDNYKVGRHGVFVKGDEFNMIFAYKKETDINKEFTKFVKSAQNIDKKMCYNTISSVKNIGLKEKDFLEDFPEIKDKQYIVILN